MHELPVNIDFYIKLIVDHSLSQEQAMGWKDLVRNAISSGVASSIQVKSPDRGLMSVTMVKREVGSFIEYIIPLTRNLSEEETMEIVNLWNQLFPEVDFDIVSSSSPNKLNNEPEDVIAPDEYSNLATIMARKAHDKWYKERSDLGWRWGQHLSVIDKTHPMLRPWEELPDQYRKTDMDAPQMIVNLLNDQGFAVVRKEEIEALLKLMKEII